MVQEVQTWVWVYNETTLETIEAIGTSSFKIIEWRQTKWWHYLSQCVATGNVYFDYSWPVPIDSWEIKSTDTAISSMSGKSEYAMSNWWVRVPQAWTYKIDVAWGWGSNTLEATLIIKAEGKIVYQKTQRPYWDVTDTFYVDMWKFGTIEIRGDFNYWGTASSISVYFWSIPTLTIQQL